MLRCCREQSLSSVPSDSLALFVSRFCAALPYASSASNSRAKIKLIHLYTIHLYTQEPELASVFQRGGAPTPNRVLAQDLDEPCSSSPGVVLCGFYGVHSDKIYRRIGGFRVVMIQKHAETRSKCHFEAI